MKVHVEYYAAIREKTGKVKETITPAASDLIGLYQEIQRKYNLPFTPSQLKVAKNNEFCDWQSSLKNDDTIIFVPPVAGG